MYDLTVHATWAKNITWDTSVGWVYTTHKIGCSWTSSVRFWVKIQTSSDGGNLVKTRCHPAPPVCHGIDPLLTAPPETTCRHRGLSYSARLRRAVCYHVQDGDASDASSWSCSSGGVCEITYDLEAVEALEQLRIGEEGGELAVLVMSGVYRIA